MKDKNTSYIRCRTCGKYIEENQSIGKIYCSEQCAATFTRCPNCGKFFPAINKDRHKGFCSLNCETVYNSDGIIVSEEQEVPDKETSRHEQKS